MTKTKKPYLKPALSSHGSVEEVTGWAGGGCGEFMGSHGRGKSFGCSVKKTGGGIADFGS
jgi:hypothetical protein